MFIYVKLSKLPCFSAYVYANVHMYIFQFKQMHKDFVKSLEGNYAFSSDFHQVYWYEQSLSKINKSYSILCF